MTISEASEFLGVAISTLRRWENENRIKSERTEGGHRRYDKSMLISLKNKQNNIKITIGYCRVSSSDQKEDLICVKENQNLFLIMKGNHTICQARDGQG